MGYYGLLSVTMGYYQLLSVAVGKIARAKLLIFGHEVMTLICSYSLKVSKSTI